jgi:DNA-binding NarL/FixJ family response regulator
LIEREPDLTVCGHSAGLEEALQAIPEARPDLVIVDLSLSGSPGLDLIKVLKAQYPCLPVLVVSMHEETLYAERALQAGALGYVMKQEPAKTVKQAIRKVLGGDMHLSEKMTTALVGKAMRRGQPAPPPLAHGKTERPRARGVPHVGPGQDDPANRGGTPPEYCDHQFLPQPHQRKT